jgi:hypothetical protein
MSNLILENENLYIIAQGDSFKKLPKIHRGLCLHVASTEFSREFRLCRVVWAGSPACSHKKGTFLQEVGHDAATVWQWRTGGKLSLPQPASWHNGDEWLTAGLCTKPGNLRVSSLKIIGAHVSVLQIFVVPSLRITLYFLLHSFRKRQYKSFLEELFIVIVYTC